MSRISAIVLFAVLISHQNLQGQVLINEIMADNDVTYADEDGDFEDWLEIYNSGSAAVNLNQYGLTDNPGNLRKWVFPDISIEGGGYLLIWCSGKNRTNPAQPLHAGFSISAGGERLMLSDVNGNILDDVPPQVMEPEQVWGRIPDGSENWEFLEQANPGLPNSSEVELPKANAPTFSQESGYFANPFTLLIQTDIAGARVHYTTDGSIPTQNSPQLSSFVAVAPISQEQVELSFIDTNLPAVRADERWQEPEGEIHTIRVIRARVYAEGYRPSDVVTHSYFIGADFPGKYDLPIISLATDKGNFFDPDTGIYIWGINGNYTQRGRDWERLIHFSLFDKNADMLYATDTGVRVHGNTTRSRPIKSIRFYARDEYGLNYFEYPFFSTKEQNIWDSFVLRNSGNDWDQAYFRDAFLAQLFIGTNLEVAHYQPVVTYLNGEYWGLYNLRDRFTEEHVEVAYNLPEEEIIVLEDNGEIDHGDPGDEQLWFSITDYLQARSVLSDADLAWVENRIDLDSFFDMVIAHVYYRNTDWPGNNIKYFRKRNPDRSESAPEAWDGRWRWMLVDADFGFGLDFDYVGGREEGVYHNTLEMALAENGPVWPNPPWSTLVLRRLLTNQHARIRFLNRFLDLLNTRLSSEYVSSKLDQISNVLRPHMSDHIRRWHGPDNMEDWEGDVSVMKFWAEEREDIQRGHLSDVLQVSGQGWISLRSENPELGSLILNTLEFEPGNRLTSNIDLREGFTGTYFRDLSITLKAEAKAGYYFNGWDGVSEEHSELDSIAVRVPIGDTLKVIARFSALPTSNEILTRPPERILFQNYPNPFNSATKIGFSLPESAQVELYVSDMNGRRIVTLFKGFSESGTHWLSADMSGYASGMYFYHLKTGAGTFDTKKMILLK